ncbi:MAG: hypothetical protein IJ197_01280 [Bacteroidaceae bacterium]|nr:hypothetical protein [Bacteroidaceae bacterium]
MNTKRFSKIIAAAVLAGAPMLWSACTDTWNEHYDVTEGGMADQPTILQSIKSDANLSNFYKVIEAISAGQTLDSPEQLTVWAPKGLTSAQADSVIAIFQEDQNSGLKWEDNRAVTQFFQNHTALYARTISSLTNDTIAMLNKKYMHLVGTSASSGSLDDNPFDEAVICSNGILYKTRGVQSFFPNVREYLEKTANLDSMALLVKSYDEYELDERSSVAGGIEDGKTVYLDSVTVLSNTLLNNYGYIQREDSVYTLLAPTNDVWTKLYDQYKEYFVYDPTVAHGDSLSDANTKTAIIQGRFFNTSTENKHNRHPEDSLVNTRYFERQAHNPRSNVYYKPFGADGILNGLESTVCSNGQVYIDNRGVIDPHTTFLGRHDYEAYQARYYEIPTDGSNEDKMNVSLGQYIIYDTDTTYNILKSYYYAQVTSKVASAQTELTYTLPNTLSGVYYNIYIVTIPDTYYNLPCWFQVKHTEKNDKGNYPTAQNYINPNPVVEDEALPWTGVLVKQSNYNRCYAASPEKVDTILIQSGVQFKYAGYGLGDGVVQLTLSSFGPSSATYREKVYTRTLRLGEIILVPFETKEEAEAAANDLDAFNDDILEANKEN